MKKLPTIFFIYTKKKISIFIYYLYIYLQLTFLPKYKQRLNILYLLFMKLLGPVFEFAFVNNIDYSITIKFSIFPFA